MDDAKPVGEFAAAVQDLDQTRRKEKNMSNQEESATIETPTEGSAELDSGETAHSSKDTTKTDPEAKQEELPDENSEPPDDTRPVLETNDAENEDNVEKSVSVQEGNEGGDVEYTDDRKPAAKRARPDEDAVTEIEDGKTDNPVVDETVEEKVEEADDSKENEEPKEYAPLPVRPIKRARTAYFIFADEKREEIKAKHPGEGVGVIARETGQMWSTLTDEEKGAYQERSAQERERVAQEIAKYKLDGIEVNGPKVIDPNALVFPVARIRKICKLDSEVNGISKEAAMLITKCAELATIKLGKECVKVAQLQNRRKLLPDDVAQVCATRESFLFLRDDVKDLVREQKKNSTKAKPAAATAAASNSKPLTAYFGGKLS